MSEDTADTIGSPGLAGLTDYERGWVGVLDELRGCPAIEVFEDSIMPVTLVAADAAEACAEIERRFGVSLDPAFQRSHLRFSMLGCAWQTVDPWPEQARWPEVHGEFYLSELCSVFENGSPVRPGDGWYWSTPEEHQLLSEFRLFDGSAYGGTGFHGALRIQPGVRNPEIWYSHVKRGHWRLDLDYRGYLDALRVTRGTYGWQYLFADEDALVGDDCEFEVENLTAMLDVFPEWFPEHDYAPLHERLARRLAARER
ncbi:hypothetical protein [Goodfellowiella coeruleoviolacea]|uniref:Uncharacterized protein n=1 Tax=Goodfellowiella coeruleoviolacea TaxID=334858 RepID=A0AAE3KGA6_9PSEU|nr:hypothetical protein [Goodfellowiella coeruleoviolacea]MCP2165667.1 hypothetical protein [Goodfellowiella coeruleoviolacea]